MIAVDCLFAPGCSARAHTLDLVREVSRELGLTVRVRETVVADQAAARAHRFLGSPTVRVDGRDIEPGAAARQDFGLG